MLDSLRTRPFVSIRAALEPRAFVDLRDFLLRSPLVSRSTLAGSFRSSRGFGVAFTLTGRARVEERWPVLAPFLAQVLDRGSQARIRWAWRRAHSPTPANAFFLNVLLLGPGGGVGRHVDATLRAPSGVADAVPKQVSVLYLQVPFTRGGELVLSDDRRRRAIIRPRSGALVHFDGALAHEVLPFEHPAPDALRASLVLEQYAFAPEAIARLPKLEVQSKGGFSAYLEDHASRAGRE